MLIENRTELAKWFTPVYFIPCLYRYSFSRGLTTCTQTKIDPSSFSTRRWLHSWKTHSCITNKQTWRHQVAVILIYLKSESVLPNKLFTWVNTSLAYSGEYLSGVDFNSNHILVVFSLLHLNLFLFFVYRVSQKQFPHFEHS